MKVKFKDLTDNGKLISHLVCEGLNEEAMKTLPPKGERNKDAEADITVLFNGVPLDVEKFFASMEEQFNTIVDRRAEPNAKKMLAKFINDYKSKNSNNAKLERIKQQCDKAFQQMTMIKQSLESFKFENDEA